MGCCVAGPLMLMVWLEEIGRQVGDDVMLRMMGRDALFRQLTHRQSVNLFFC